MPPYFAGLLMPRKPWSPIFLNSSWAGKMPASSHSSTCGLISRVDEFLARSDARSAHSWCSSCDPAPGVKHPCRLSTNLLFSRWIDPVSAARVRLHPRHAEACWLAAAAPRPRGRSSRHSASTVRLSRGSIRPSSHRPRGGEQRGGLAVDFCAVTRPSCASSFSGRPACRRA